VPTVLEGRARASQNHTRVILQSGEAGPGNHRILKHHSIASDEQDVSVAVQEPVGGDWLDACCWRCGAAEALPDPLGRRLCPTCLAELLEAPPDGPLRVVRSAYWDAHALERCWRCLTESVDAEDDVGLCRTLASLSATDATTAESVPGR